MIYVMHGSVIRGLVASPGWQGDNVSWAGKAGLGGAAERSTLTSRLHLGWKSYMGIIRIVPTMPSQGL